MKALMLLTGVVCLATTLTVQAKPESFHQAAQASNQFGFEFYKQVKRSEAQPGRNRLLSPVSAYFALAMTSNGARGTTEEAIRQTIAAHHLPRPALNATNLAFLKTLNSRQDVQLEIANSVWTREGLGLLEAFEKSATTYYEAEARELDFSDDKSADIMNQWVSDKTHGKITKVVQKPIEDDFYLMNATYFKGSWMYPFEESQTKPATFHALSGDRKVDTMNSVVETNYLRANGYEVVELPYGDKYEASLLLFVTDNLDRLEDSLNDQEWKRINASLTKPEANHMVTLALPKFQFEDDADLVQPLSDMGMAIAFGGGADFLDLTRVNMSLSKAFQKTYIKLDEIGTEAAAVTVIAGTTSVPVAPPVTVKADRPFLVAIRDNETQALLFLGAVVEP